MKKMLMSLILAGSTVAHAGVGTLLETFQAFATKLGSISIKRPLTEAKIIKLDRNLVELTGNEVAPIGAKIGWIQIPGYGPHDNALYLALEGITTRSANNANLIVGLRSFKDEAAEQAAAEVFEAFLRAKRKELKLEATQFPRKRIAGPTGPEDTHLITMSLADISSETAHQIMQELVALASRIETEGFSAVSKSINKTTKVEVDPWQ